jgi:hypothetical protein
MAEYSIIRKDNILDMRQAVNESIEKGFKPTGGIMVIVDRFNDDYEVVNNAQHAKRTMYYQSMFKE